MVSLNMREMTGGHSCWDEQGMHSVAVNPRYGSGSLSAVTSLQRDISLVIQNFTLHGNTEIRMIRGESSPPFLAFSVCLSGVTHLVCNRPRIPLGQGFTDIVISGQRDYPAMTVASNTPVQTIGVCVPLSSVEGVTGRNIHHLVADLDRLDNQAARATCCYRSRELDMAQQACACQIFSVCRNFPYETFFLEAKALELMALQLRQLDSLLGKNRPYRQRRSRAENIVYASEILKREMADPPTILDLSQRVGLNYNQLIEGFRQMFGQTPFEYLRILRLEKARDLITSREYNVTEAALEVGYLSQSHFTKAFRSRFGITPKALQKTTKKQHASTGTKESN